MLRLGSMGIVALLVHGARGQALAAWPEVEDLPTASILPDPFQFHDGRRVQSAAEWDLRREEIKFMLQFYQYGHMPPPPGNMMASNITERPVYGGAGVERRLTLWFGPKRALSLHIGLIVPDGDGPYPVVMKNDMGLGHVPIAEELIRKGYIVAEYVVTDLDPDRPNELGPAQAAYPDYDWGTLAVWVWGGMRVVDYLVTLREVDPTRLAVTGHSRGGKAALLHGAMDERIALTAPNGSGAGGASSYRLTGPKPETLELITRPERFAYWFHPRLRDFVGWEDRLPFDQHFLKALVAPRALLTTDAREDLWANPLGNQHTYLAAEEVYRFLHASEKHGLSMREGMHDQLEDDWRTLLRFMEWHFHGRSDGDSNSFKTLPYPDEKKVFTWETPTHAAAQKDARILRHPAIYRHPGRYAGWPANHGIWSWGLEILVGFSVGWFKDLGPERHAIDRDRPEEHWLARSFDGGASWSLEHPGANGQLVPFGRALHGIVPPELEQREPRLLTEPMDFSAPGFAMTLRMTDVDRGPSRLFYSLNKGRDWFGPFVFPDLGTPGIAARTDYLINGPRDGQVFVTCAKGDGEEGRPVGAHTRDGGLNWTRLGFMGSEPEGFAIMPSVVRVSQTVLVAAVRCREAQGRWIDAYRSADNGRTWRWWSRPVKDTGEGNPPHLIQLRDGRLCLTYGYRAAPYSIRARLSEDQGKSWGEDRVLRDGGGGRDLGYPRTVQRPDGNLVTVYYFHETPLGDRFVEATIWEP